MPLLKLRCVRAASDFNEKKHKKIKKQKWQYLLGVVICHFHGVLVRMYALLLLLLLLLFCSHLYVVARIITCIGQSLSIFTYHKR